MWHVLRTVVVTCCVFLPLWKSAHADHGNMVFMYSDHEPYIVSTDSGLSGFVASYLNKVTASANITAHWNYIAWSKQLPALKRNPKNVCAVTLFKTPEREQYLRFTAAIGSNGGFTVIGAKNNHDLINHSSLKEVLDDTALAPALQMHTVYSTYINGLLKEKDFPRVHGSIQRLARSITAGTHDYFILADVRAKAFFKKPEFIENFTIYRHFNDLSTEGYYYIGCSLATDETIFNQLNKAILHHGLAQEK